MKADLLATGFEIVDFRDVTSELLEAHRRFRDRVEESNRPRIAVEVLMGERAVEIQRNSIRTIEDGRALAIEALARKPGR